MSSSATCTRHAWSFVEPPNDWKARVCAVVEEASCDYDEHVICDAVLFMTSTMAKVTRIDGLSFRVVADGYRMGPAGP